MIRFQLSKVINISKSILCIIALSLLTPSVIAQSGSDLPRSTVEAISINGAQRTQIESFIEAWTVRAEGDNAADTRKALEALTKPLQERGVSVAFRQAYATAITPLMNSLESSDSIGAHLSSLRIAGDLGTPTAATRIKAGLNSDDLGVLIFATSRAGQLFSTTKRHGPAMTPNDAIGVIDALKASATNSSAEPELLRASIRALSIAASLPSNDMGDARSHAIVALADIVGPRLRSLSVSDDPSFELGLSIDASAASTVSISDISSQTTPEAVKAAVGLGADVISISLRRVLGKTIEPTSERDLTVRATRAGETLLYFSLQKHAELSNVVNGNIRQTSFADQLESGDDKAFRNAASLHLGPGSFVVTEFDFADERFLR
ncbi:MAG: hypothetical protein P1U42_10735 [Phycisphaerales bacterium]|nr:hypothetical protein [Phycisphaerales bacterium]